MSEIKGIIKGGGGSREEIYSWYTMNKRVAALSQFCVSVCEYVWSRLDI